MMRHSIRKNASVVMAVVMLLGGIQIPVTVQAQDYGNQISEIQVSEGVTVTTREEFMAALKQRQSPIIVTNLISIGQEAEDNGQMKPVIFPENTVIRGTANGKICSRSPIQLEGDGVCFENIELTFESSDALGSVPHREIFLAGHSLTLDGVNTYLDGGGAEIGGIGGFEEELLPTVYAGGYPGTSIGDNASLTVKNSGDETMFQAIYMGHGAGSDQNVPYHGDVELNLDAKVIVREEIDISSNSHAEIRITGTEYSSAKAKKFYGNEYTTLTVNKASLEGAVVDGVGNIVLENGACLTPETYQLHNLVLREGSCLDLSRVGDAVVSGDFEGESDPAKEKGILVLDSHGSLTIHGNVTGTTQFQTGHRLFPGVLLVNKSYIFAKSVNEAEPEFVLAQKSIDAGYELGYSGGEWTVHGDVPDYREIGRIDIRHAPSRVNLKRIRQSVEEEGTIPDENVYFDITWYDKDGEPFDDIEVINDYMFYEWDYVIGIRTDYWESESADILDKTDWGTFVSLMASEEHLGKYFLKAVDEESLGDYTYLFCSGIVEEYLETVADVKKLKGMVMKECRVTFYSQEVEEPDGSEHIHNHEGKTTKEATCTEPGAKTYTCSCGDEYTEEIEAAGHKEVVDEAVEPTETTEGKTEGSHCENCGEIIIEQEAIPALGKPEHRHEYTSKVTKEATCTEPGVKTYTCSCGDEYTEEIKATGHKEVVDEAVEPTETTEGKTEGSHCESCGEIIIEQEAIPALGKPEHRHEYTVEVTEATCTSPGEKTYTCNCGEQYTEEITALGHKYTEKCIPATMKQSGEIQQICSVCSDSRTVTVIASPGKITCNKTDFSYDGKTKTPSITVKDSKGKKLTAGKDYRVIYPKGRKNPGEYTLTVEFCGNYSGKAAKTFTIRPKKTSLKKVAAKSKAMQVTWKKQTVQMDGYQIQYCTNGSFKGKTAKLITAGKNSTAKKISGLKAKKKYYVRIRTYKTVKINGKKIKLYSDWSAGKSVRTKK